MHVVRLKTAKRAMLECSSCGAAGQLSCDCGAPYVAAGARAAKAVARNPEKSDRAIAADIGVTHPTVAKARREAGGKDFPPVRRVGRDGKSYTAGRKPGSAEIVDETNLLHREMGRFMTSFTPRFERWAASNPPDEAKDALYQALRICSEEFARFASDLNH